MLNSTASVISNSTSDLDHTARLIISQLHAVQHPSVYPYVPWVLIACSIFYLLVIILCVTILAFLILGGRESRRRNLWLWRHHYVGKKGPYLIPNGGLFVILCQMIGSILLNIYIILSYHSIRSHNSSQSQYQNFWLTISYVPGYLGFWYSGFTALYLCLFSPSRPVVNQQFIEHSLLHPIFMNIICIGVPIIVALGALFWGVASIVVARGKDDAYAAVIAHITSRLDPTASLQEYEEAGLRCISEFRWGSVYWAIAALVVVLFYYFTGVLFLRFLKGTVNVATGKTKLVNEIESPIDLVESSESRMAESLLKGYRFLVWQFSFLLIVLIWHLMISSFFAIRIEEIVKHEELRSAAAWVVVSSSCILSGVLIIINWRAMTNRDELHEPSAPPTSFKDVERSQLDDTSESKFPSIHSSTASFESQIFTNIVLPLYRSSEDHPCVLLKQLGETQGNQKLSSSSPNQLALIPNLSRIN